MYLLFFGKSQSFTWEAFDAQGLATEFNSQFPGFEALESKIMTIDRRDNPPVWAKYRLKDQFGKWHSLLKVYAFAQAFDGSRIAGSTYGVALLSAEDLLWDPINMDILEAARVNFSKLVLQQQKFKKTNFTQEAKAIWEGMIHFQEGNLFHKVRTQPLEIPTQNLMSLSFPDLKGKAAELERIGKPYERFYATTDAEHLLRMQEKWGRDRFPIWGQMDGLPKPPPSPKMAQHHPKVQALLSKTDEEEDDFQEEVPPNLPNRWLKIFPWVIAVSGWGLAGYLYFQPAPKPIDPKAELRTWQYETFTQASKRDTLQNLLQNIRFFQADTNQKYPQAILRDGQALQLDSLTLETLLDRKP